LWAAKRADKQKKAAVDRLARAIHRLEIALNDTALPSGFRGSALREQLSQLRAASEKIALAKLPKPRRDVSDKRAAVREAAALLQALARPLTRSRRGEFCRLAGVF